MLRPIVDHLSTKAWRGTRGDEAGQFLLQPSDLTPGVTPASMHVTLTALYAHARRWAPGLDIPFFVPPVHLRIDSPELAGNFRIDDSFATIGVSRDHVGDAAATLLILAHEACHHFLFQAQLNDAGDAERDEITTDLAMFVFGFGELVLRGHSRIRVKRGASKRERVHLGYLSAAEYQNAQDYVLSLRAKQGLPGRVDRGRPIESGESLGVSALLADMLDAASLDAASLDAAAPVPVKTPEPPQLPSRRRDTQSSRAATKSRSDGIEWIQLDETVARRHGLPALIPGPAGQLARIAEEGLDVDLCRAWVKDFLVSSEAGKSGVWRKKNAALVSSFEAFVDKGPLWEKAQKAFAEGDHARATTALKRIVAMDADDHAARLDLAFELALAGDNPGALKSLKAIKKTFEGEAQYHVAVGRVHVALQDRTSALNELVRALEADPDCQSAFAAMAELGISDVPGYLQSRRAEAAAKAEEKARAEEEARAKENARARAAAEAEEKALRDARARSESASILADTAPRPPGEQENLKTSSGMRDDPLDTARLPGLSAAQRRQLIERGRKPLADEAAKVEEQAPSEAPVPEEARAETPVEGALGDPDEQLAPTKSNLAPVGQTALDETGSRARGGRRTALVVAAIVVALALAILGSRLLSP